MTKTDMWCRACINGKPQIKHDSNTSHDPNIIQQVFFFRKNAPQSRISARRFVIQKSFHSCTDTLMYKNQRQNKYDYNSGNTHNCRHTGLTFIRILRIHI